MLLKRMVVGQLQEGMVIAADVFEANIGVNIPSVRHGVVLTNDYINRLKNRGIAYVLVETPEGYRGAPGEVYEIDSVHIKGDILFDGRVQINGDLSPQVKIEAGERIVIEGDVGEGCLLNSANGGILIKGSVCGSREYPVNVMSSQNVLVQSQSDYSASFADIKASGDINISGSITDSSISARGEIIIHGEVCNSTVYSQTRIMIKDCGSEWGDPSVLMVKPFECRELSQELLQLDAKSAEMLKEKERLQNTVGLIKKVGKDIGQLPHEKKIELAAGVKRFRQIEEEVSSLPRRKTEIKIKIEQSLEEKRIIVVGNIFPRSKVTIENSSLEMTKKVSGAAFFMKGLKVVLSPYSGGF
jgi:uncharacterized protein (DUF342 family)